MKLLDALRAECTAVGARPANKREALAEVARLAKKCPCLARVQESNILKGLEERESVGTTGFGRGIAIPHCRLEGADDFAVGILTVPDGVPFDALDHKPVKLIVFIIGPARVSNDHIRLLSGISRVLSIPGAVEEMVAASTPEVLRETFLRHVRDEPEAGKGVGRNMFHVFIQDEDVFREILQIFGGTEPRFTAVLDAENASRYLAKMPLFAGLWTDDPRSFTRIILSLVDKRMTNEMIRRIEQVAGPLEKSPRVLVAVVDVFFCAGSLTS
jgi:PTS system nitrogen regulatory IIA component